MRPLPQPFKTARRRVRRKRRSAVTSAPPPPAGPPSLLSVTLVDGATVRLTFSAPVAVDPDPGPLDFNFHVGEQQPDAVMSTGAALVDVTFLGGVGTGDSWFLDGQPNWLITAVTTPASGVVE